MMLLNEQIKNILQQLRIKVDCSNEKVPVSQLEASEDSFQIPQYTCTTTNN